MKKELEEAYDIPFSVHKSDADKNYIVCPQNDMDEYFEIHISFRSDVRIIIEIYPQQHAADMLNDMACADQEKKALFLGYLETFINRGFKVAVKVNGVLADLRKTWPEKWHGMYIRITKIEEPEINYRKVATDGAVLAAGMMLSLLNVVPVNESEGFADGKKISVIQDRYERNPLNRELCLQANGCTCMICGFDFEKKYGRIGKGFIHVHHIHQLSLAGGPVKIDPVHDLIPVCPNCHAMLHTSTPPLMPEELIRIIKENEDNEK